MLSRQDYRTLSLSSLGGALEFYDFIIYIFFAKEIGSLFFPHHVEWLQQVNAYAVFAAGYLARPLGGLVMAHSGDLFGRKRMFMLSILLMALPTLAIGLLPTYATLGFWAPLALLVLRTLQGAAVGGEIPGAWVFVSEHVQPRHIGVACGMLTAGLTGGILLGTLVATGVHHLYPTEGQMLQHGWRVPFIIGGGFGMLAVWLRRYLQETPVFRELQAEQKLADEMPLKRVVRGHGGSVALVMALTWLLSAAIVVMILMTPALLQKLYHIPPATTLAASSVATLFLSVGCIAFGALSDRFGPGSVLAIGCVALGVVSLGLYHWLPVMPGHIYELYALCGLFVGVIGVVPVVGVSAFPAEVRFSGLSFSYNVAYAIFGGLTPVAVSWAMRLDPFAAPHYVAALCVVGVLAGIYLLRKPVMKLA